jgi:hypothetical protein
MGQEAMARAMIYPDPQKGERENKKVVETTGFSNERLSHARTVLGADRDLASAVLGEGGAGTEET